MLILAPRGNGRAALFFFMPRPSKGKKNFRKAHRRASRLLAILYRALASRSFMFLHSFSGHPRPERISRTQILNRPIYASALWPHLPNPSPKLPQDSNGPASNDTQEQPLTREELEALIDFFTLLDIWDKKKTIA